MTPIAVFIATTGGPVLIERITAEAAPQSMICLGRSSEVLPISAAYDDFVRPGSGVIMREFGPYEEGAFRLDVAKPVDMGKSWQLAVFIAHALMHDATYELSDLASAETVLWLTGEVDYDLNIHAISHLNEKLISSAGFFDQCRQQGKRVIAAAPLDNKSEGETFMDLENADIHFIAGMGDIFKLLSLKSAARKKPSSNRKFAAYVIFVLAAVISLIWFTKPELIPLETLRYKLDLQDRKNAPEHAAPTTDETAEADFTLALNTDRGRTPSYRFGEDLHLEFRLSSPGWLYCFYLQAKGDVIQIFPNPQVSKAIYKDPFASETTFVLTGNDGLPFNIRFSPPAGRERLACYATSRNVAADLPPSLRGESLKPLAEEYALTLQDVFSKLEDTALATDSLDILLSAK